jgi:hypothetical protein
MSMRDFLTATQSTIELLDHSVAKLQREQDAFLMDIVLRDKRFRPAQIRRINFCRLYLKVLLISDICTATGDSIDPDMYSGATPKPQRAQKANQPSPTSKSWQQWKRLMHILCHGRVNMKLRTPLGRWTVPSHELRRQWPFFYNPINDTLIHLEDEQYTFHRRMVHDFDKDEESAIPHDQPLPPEVYPVAVIDRPNAWTVPFTNLYMKPSVPPPLPPPESFFDLLPEMEPWETHLLVDVEFLCGEQHVWETLQHKSCIIASDGSAPEEKGSFAWVISDRQGNQLVHCYGPVFGSRITSYRSEGCGILSPVRFLARMKQVHQPVQHLPPPTTSNYSSRR